MKIKNMKIKNMTPHGVNIIDKEGGVLMTFPSMGQIRLSQETERVGSLSVEGAEIPLSRTSFGGVDIPEEDGETIYIVSSLVCQARPDRGDLLIVNETVRDDNGCIIGCRSLSRNPFYGDSQ
jgi:hypothetical protein